MTVSMIERSLAYEDKIRFVWATNVYSIFHVDLLENNFARFYENATEGR